jgi:hypothetical protein
LIGHVVTDLVVGDMPPNIVTHMLLRGLFKYENTIKPTARSNSVLRLHTMYLLSSLLLLPVVLAAQARTSSHPRLLANLT